METTKNDSKSFHRNPPNISTSICRDQLGEFSTEHHRRYLRPGDNLVGLNVQHSPLHVSQTKTYTTYSYSISSKNSEK